MLECPVLLHPKDHNHAFMNEIAATTKAADPKE